MKALLFKLVQYCSVKKAKASLCKSSRFRQKKWTRPSVCADRHRTDLALTPHMLTRYWDTLPIEKNSRDTLAFCIPVCSFPSPSTCCFYFYVLLCFPCANVSRRIGKSPKRTKGITHPLKNIVTF